MAISDISLTAGMRNNLLALQKTSQQLSQTQDRLSSGKRVNSALDNPTNFFAAQAHMERASDLNDRKDGMSEAVQTIKNADNGIKAITALIQAAKGLATAQLTTAEVIPTEPLLSSLLPRLAMPSLPWLDSRQTQLLLVSPRLLLTGPLLEMQAVHCHTWIQH